MNVIKVQWALQNGKGKETRKLRKFVTKKKKKLKKAIDKRKKKLEKLIVQINAIAESICVEQPMKNNVNIFVIIHLPFVGKPSSPDYISTALRICR